MAGEFERRLGLEFGNGIKAYVSKETSFEGKLKDYRVKKGLSQRHLAHKTGVDHATISRLETGRRDFPSLSTFAKIVIGLRLNSEQIIDVLSSVVPEEL